MFGKVKLLIQHEREMRELWQISSEDLIKARSTHIDARLDEMNMLRHQIESERGQYLTRDMYDRDRSELTDRLRLMELGGAAAKTQLWIMGGAITVCTSVIAIFAEVMMRILWK